MVDAAHKPPTSGFLDGSKRERMKKESIRRRTTKIILGSNPRKKIVMDGHFQNCAFLFTV